MSKICNKCNVDKNLEDFNKDPRNSDGRSGICRACKIESGRARREQLAKTTQRSAPTAKACSECTTTKPIDEFYKDKVCVDGHSSICKECKTKKVYAWREANKDRYNASQRAFQAKVDPEKKYGAEIKRRYGCTLEQYNEMLVAQGGRCAVSGTLHNPAEKKGRLYVDHDHKTGKVRQLLCGACNSLLGYAEDKIETLEAAIAYLKKHNGAA